jgi:hypothetical protein
VRVGTADARIDHGPGLSNGLGRPDIAVIDVDPGGVIHAVTVYRISVNWSMPTA